MLREGLACTQAIYIDACDSSMKSWTRSKIPSQAWVGVLIPIIIVVWVRLELLVRVVGARAYQQESK